MQLTVRLPSGTLQATVDVQGFECCVSVQDKHVLTVPLPLRVASATADLCQQSGGDALLSLTLNMYSTFRIDPTVHN